MEDMNLIKGDCIEELKKIPDKSVEFVYMDFPFNQTACKWDQKAIDLDKIWIELKRIAKNDKTPFFFSCTTRFGYKLIKANEKWFRWDLVWKKNRASGFLNAYKLPMRKHEMIYCFAKKSPEYDVSSHKESKTEVSREGQVVSNGDVNGRDGKKAVCSKTHNERLPTSDITPPKGTLEYETYGRTSKNPLIRTQTKHENRLPTSDLPIDIDDQPPSSWCEVNNDERTGHRTAKPVALMEFLLKYWTKPEWTVLDPTMGSGSMGIACKKMGRKFIGMELDDDIYKLAQKRISEAVVPK